MGKWAAGLLVTWVLTGCSASPSAFQGVVAVAGEWQFRATTTGVIPGATVPPISVPIPMPTVGMVTTGQWQLSQNNRTVSGAGVNAATGVTFSLLGELEGGSLILESLGSNPVCGTVRVRLNLRLNGEGTELQGTGVTEGGGCFRSQETIVATRLI